MSQENKVGGWGAHFKWKNPVQTFLNDEDLWMLLFTSHYNGRLQDDLFESLHHFYLAHFVGSGNSRCFSASLNPLTVCFHTKLIEDFLNREHAMKERSNSGIFGFSCMQCKVHSVLSHFCLC